DTFLDTFSQERTRGITIFSKQARFVQGEMEITLLDTPGHVDFSAEMERTLQVLDVAILVISGADGVQGHTHTLWNLLARYGIPTFLFINKMDQEGTDPAALMSELKEQLSDSCVEFSSGNGEAFQESLAMCSEALLEEYMENGSISTVSIAEAVTERTVFPCYFGSALKLDGVEELLAGISAYTNELNYGERFGARVFKISRDDQGNRLTHLKLTGGNLKVKAVLSGDRAERPDRGGSVFESSVGGGAESERWEEKISQIRLYSGEKYETVNEVSAGCVCAVAGLTYTYPGQGLGAEEGTILPVLEPVLTYRILLPDGCDVRTVLPKLRQLEEEEPELHIVWNEQLGELHAQLMGEVQTEVLRSLIADRFGFSVEFGEGNIVYKETIAEPVEGVGHYEPLRHYSEVHLLLTPGEPGSGLRYGSDCSEEVLAKNWQRLILTHLEEKEHVGVLIGAPITDMQITLIAGKAHLKHTEGGDFRQSTYRAVRQGLKCAKSVLLEPWYQFKLEVPLAQVGRAMTDIQSMFGEFTAPETIGEMAVLTGSAPVACMRNYQAQVAAYTGGRGRLFCTVKGYLPCHNAEEVIESRDYDSEADLDNPTGSVFCTHGAGFWVPWDEVRNYMHVESGWTSEVNHAGSVQAENKAEFMDIASCEQDTVNEPRGSQIYRGASFGTSKLDEELEEIFTRTYGPIKRERSLGSGPLVREYAAPVRTVIKKSEPQTEYLLVDGYNIIFAWEELSALAKENIDSARGKLMDVLCNYQGAVGCELILVFDAYRVQGGTESVQDYHNIHVVYTREAETADQYIEKATRRIAKHHRVTVATSDGMEQVIILGAGAIRMSARELQEEIERVCVEMRKEFLGRFVSGKNYLFDHLDEEMRDVMEDVRLGKKRLADE
ncbi:MAG: TetM/TetW/TetO/TetS family tetracycline resistance ribosomal protection protein, partial [Lachnospiraceae bacterium]|nr:TetM/TetW/TetO/TetS family tetracycline resistance ribosomal protection protein [Lachnospiraceae bacterium]